MKTNLKLTLVLLVFTFLSCNKQASLEYKYSEKEDVFTCENIDSKLFKEALYSFESDLTNFYDRNEQNALQKYRKFIGPAVKNTLNLSEIVSPHTIQVFEELKNVDDLWNLNSKKSKLNYNHPIISCIAKNIKNQDLKTTFSALTTTNSMSPKLIGAPLSTSYQNLTNDKYLAMYTALDFYYARLFDIDLSNVIEPDTPSSSIDFNKRPAK